MNVSLNVLANVNVANNIKEMWNNFKWIYKVSLSDFKFYVVIKFLTFSGEVLATLN